MHDFAVINSTSDPLEVAIRYLNRSEVDLRVTSAELFQESDKKWAKLDPGRIRFDKERQTHTVTLGPGQALLVDEKINYIDHDSESFEIVELAFRQGEKTRVMEGKSAQQAFRKQEGFDYALTFSGF